jgi:hypothetical protein
MISGLPGNASERVLRQYEGRTPGIAPRPVWAASWTGLCPGNAESFGRKKAAVTVAHRILVLAYHIIRDGGEYRERGGDYFDRVDAEHIAFRLSQRLQRIGYDVVLTRRPEAAMVETEVAPETGVMREARTAPAAAGRKRGRPCECAERGRVRTHPNPQPARPTKPASAPTPSPSPQGCTRCQRWGIACIHVRPRKSKIPFPVTHSESKG